MFSDLLTLTGSYIIVLLCVSAWFWHNVVSVNYYDCMVRFVYDHDEIIINCCVKSCRFCIVKVCCVSMVELQYNYSSVKMNAEM